MRSAARTRCFLVSGLVLGMGLSGCGAGTATPGPGSSASIERVEAQLVRLHDRLYGTVADRIAADRLTYVRLQLPLMQCMAKAGFSYTPPPFSTPYVGWPATRALADDDVLAPVDSTSVRRDAFFQRIDTAPGVNDEAIQNPKNPGFTSLPPVKRALYSAQSDRCMPDSSTFADLITMESAAPLKIRLEATLSKAKAGAAVRQEMAKYPGCLAAAGFSAKARSDLFEQVRLAFLNKDPTRFHPGTPTWTAAVRLENTAAAADADCRRAGHNAAMLALAAPLNSLVRKYAQQFSAVDRDWTTRVQAANAAMPDLRRLMGATAAASAKR